MDVVSGVVAEDAAAEVEDIADEVVEEAEEEAPVILPGDTPSIMDFGSGAIKGAGYHTWIRSDEGGILQAEVRRKNRTVSYSLVLGGDTALVGVPSRVKAMRAIDLASILAKYTKLQLSTLEVGAAVTDYTGVHINPGVEVSDEELGDAAVEGTTFYQFKVEGIVATIVPEPEIEAEAEAEDVEETAEG